MYKRIDGFDHIETEFGVQFKICFTKHIFERALQRYMFNRRETVDAIIEILDNPELHDVLFNEFTTSEVKEGVEFVVTSEETGMTICCVIKEYPFDGYVVTIKTALPKVAWVRDEDKIFQIDKEIKIKVGGLCSVTAM